MKKKRWAIWICCVLALALAACQPRVPGKNVTTDTERILFGGNADYSLVYPSGASDGLKEQVSGLRKTVQALTGGRAETVSDDDAKHPERDFEILIGLTGRSESRQGYDAVNPSGYRVEWIGNKLVLSGSSDYFVGMAIRELQASWQVADGKITCRRSLSLSGDGAGQVTALLNENGISNYRLVLPDDSRRPSGALLQSSFRITGIFSAFGCRLIMLPLRRLRSMKFWLAVPAERRAMPSFKIWAFSVIALKWSGVGLLSVRYRRICLRAHFLIFVYICVP